MHTRAITLTGRFLIRSHNHHIECGRVMDGTVMSWQTLGVVNYQISMMLLFTQYYCRLVSQCGREALLERINLKSRYDRYAKVS